MFQDQVLGLAIGMCCSHGNKVGCVARYMLGSFCFREHSEVSIIYVLHSFVAYLLSYLYNLGLRRIN